MASTGEVACLGDDFDEAFLKALISVGYHFPPRAALISSGPIESKAELLESIRTLQNMNVKLYATGGTAKFLEANKVSVETLSGRSIKKEPKSYPISKMQKLIWYHFEKYQERIH